MKSLLLTLIRAVGRLARDESGEFLSTRRKSRRLKEMLPDRQD